MALKTRIHNDNWSPAMKKMISEFTDQEYDSWLKDCGLGGTRAAGSVEEDIDDWSGNTDQSGSGAQRQKKKVETKPFDITAEDIERWLKNS